MSARRGVGRRLAEFETNCILAEREFTTLDKTAMYKDKVEPCIYVIKLLLGIVCVIISAVLVVHLFMFVLL